jgi:hypothetical protein
MKTIVTMLFLGFLSVSFAHADANSLEVKSVKGSVKYDNKIIKSGDKLTPGGLLEVGVEKDALVDILFPEGHHLRLKNGGRLKIKGSEGNLPSRFDLYAGQLFGYFVKNKNAEKIKIETKSVIAGVRGTKYMIEENSKGTYICVCDGVVAVYATDKPTDFPVRVKAGQDLWARLGGGYGKPGETLGRPTTSPDMSKMTTDEFKAMGY